MLKRPLIRALALRQAAQYSVDINKNVLESLQRGGISRVAFVRHGQTGPKQGSDFDRQLTVEGRHQVETARKSYMDSLQPMYSRAMVSPAPRTMETARILLEGYPHVDIREVPVIYDATMQPEGSKLFKQLGYAPLRDYIEHENTDVRSTARDVLFGYASNVFNTLPDHLTDREEGSTLLIIGHAIYLPSLTYTLAGQLGSEALDTVLDCNTQEAEGYLLDLSNGKVNTLKRSQV